MKSKAIDDLPPRYKAPTFLGDMAEAALLDNYNYAKGIATGLAYRADAAEARVAELEQQLELAFAYERERIAQALEALKLPGTAKVVRSAQCD